MGGFRSLLCGPRPSPDSDFELRFTYALNQAVLEGQALLRAQLRG